MLWQGLQRDVQYSVTAAEMVIYSGYWKESPVEKDQRGDVPPPWEGGTGTLACWGITFLHECAPSKPAVPWCCGFSSYMRKTMLGRKKASSPCQAREKPKRTRFYSQPEGQCKTGQEHLHNQGTAH